ncbi:S-adenosyl-L-methionine-dependent methyltransferase [Crassisporium funariophilum]|nr:S-adenosyl-L-methionine-dependent methyltransferase [Crassisporium funariophilum]
MIPLESSPPIAASHSTASTSFNTIEGKRNYRRKDFQYKYGQRHHSYDSEKAPYPLSYDKHVLEIESLDNRLAQYLRGSVSFVNFEERPSRCLDLGCGTGTWVIDAAKEWPECELVGFDLVDIQISHKLLNPSIAKRIEWRHGNFLTTKLPFDDDEFDHVHIQAIAQGVPENKWGVLFEEVSRVLRPGGSVEIIEDDAVFPFLPRWFTTALRARPLRAQSVHYPDGSQRGYPTHTPSSSSSHIPTHDHALLESLHKSVFEHRFINRKPSAVLPSYLTTYFRQVTLGPVLHFPMPPLPPILPLPPQITTSYIVEPSSDILDARASTVISPTHQSSRPMSLSFSSSMSSTTVSATPKSSFSSSRPRTSSAPFSYGGESSFSSFNMSVTNGPSPIDVTTLPLKRFMFDVSTSESDLDALPPSLFPREQLANLTDRSLAMHLYRSYQYVLACQEAMWEELKDRIRNRKHELLPFGWDDDEELEELQSRKKFERLVERYRTDMQARVSMWCSLDSLGWPLPSREPLSKAELIEEERLRESMIEARKYATVEEMQVPCRAVRVLIGYNP